MSIIERRDRQPSRGVGTAASGLAALAALSTVGIAALLARQSRERAIAVCRQRERDIAELGERVEALSTAASEHRRAREVAETASEAKSRYMVAVSHEIRSPLNAIYGYAQLLERDHAISGVEAGSVIRHSVEHLTNLVEGLLEISRIESGVLKVCSDEIDLPALLDGIIAMFRMQAAAKGLTLDLVAKGKLPARVRTDEKRLRQILINLLSNAVKYTQEGGVTVTIGYRSQVADIEVRDTGIGVAADDMERIFQPFERGHSAETRFQPGIGLGLSITRVLTRILGGDLVATSTVGVGSVFRLRLLLPERVRAETDMITPGRRIVGYEGVRRTVLIVDDDVAHGTALKTFLQAVGFTVCVATNGEEGVALAARGAIDIALLDIQMPGMSGWELAKRLRADHPMLPIVMVSANANESRANGDDPNSHNAFVAKPVAFDTLLSTIGSQLGLGWQSVDDAPGRGSDVAPFERAPAEAGPFLATMRQQAKVGHIGGVDGTLDELEQAIPAARPLVAQLRRHAERFDLRSLVKALDNAER